MFSENHRHFFTSNNFDWRWWLTLEICSKTPLLLRQSCSKTALFLLSELLQNAEVHFHLCLLHCFMRFGYSYRWLHMQMFCGSSSAGHCCMKGHSSGPWKEEKWTKPIKSCCHIIMGFVRLLWQSGQPYNTTLKVWCAKTCKSILSSTQFLRAQFPSVCRSHFGTKLLFS